MTDRVLEEERQQARLAVGARSSKHVLEVIVDSVLAETQALGDQRHRAQAGEQEKHDVVFPRRQLVAVRKPL